MSRYNDHIQSDDGHTDTHTHSNSTYRLGPSSRMGRVKSQTTPFFCSIDWHALHWKDFPRLRYRKCDRVQSLWAVYWKRASKVSNISSLPTSAELTFSSMNIVCCPICSPVSSRRIIKKHFYASSENKYRRKGHWVTRSLIKLSWRDS